MENLNEFQSSNLDLSNDIFTNMLLAGKSISRRLGVPPIAPPKQGN